MIGVLALQGGFAEHIKALDRLGVPSVEIRKLSDLDHQFDGLIFPGGESTTIGRLLHETGLFEPLKAMIDSGMPVFGTCAGMILLAKHLENDAHTYFQAIDITVKRNAFGRQLGSFQTQSDFKGVGEVPMTFIRAPHISSAGENVKILATVDGRDVAAEAGNILVTAFHPELTDDLSILKYFLSFSKR